MRHIPARHFWYTKDDNLQGSEAVGNSNVDTAEWSKVFETEVPNFNKFLFASGDCAEWLITTKEQAIGEYYSNGT